MSKLTPEEFREYLKTVRALAEVRSRRCRRRWRSPTSSRRNSTTWPSRTTCTATRCPRSTVMGPVREGDPAGAGGVLPRTGRHAHAPALRRRPELAHPRRLRQAGAQGRVHGQVPGQDHLHELRADRADGRTGADLHTTALKDENGNYVLNGEKWLISHTDCSQYAYVIAVTDLRSRATSACPPSSCPWTRRDSNWFPCRT